LPIAASRTVALGGTVATVGFPNIGMQRFLESVPAVSAKLKAPITADRKFSDVVKSAQDAAVLVLVY
jgi:hypothetical protein